MEKLRDPFSESRFGEAIVQAMKEPTCSAYPLVSIITPIYNHEQYVEETIHSVLQQTYRNIEFIIVNDGSTDGSREIVEKYKSALTIIDQRNAGQAEALNVGWSMASGKYIGYLSSDDVLMPSCIEALVKVLEANSGIVCAYPNGNLISPSSSVLKHGVFRPFDLEELVVEQGCYIGPGALWRASAHRQIGGWKPQLKLCPDREYWMRLAACGEFYFEEQVLASYRLHPSSISASTTTEKVSLEYIRILNEYYENPQLPSGILARKNEAYANAYWVVARNMLREGSFKSAAYYLNQAYKTDPTTFNASNIVTLFRSSVGKHLRLLVARIRGKVAR